MGYSYQCDKEGLLMTAFNYKRVTTELELHQILQLQEQNAKDILSESEKTIEGFVSVKHSFKLLKQMNTACPHVVALDNDKVVGYALCMLRLFRDSIPSLIPMFNHTDIVLNKKNLSHLSYLVMGQVCIDKAYRKQGVFRGLYNYFKTSLINEYDAVITEVNTKNTRSFEAHKAVGFQLLDTHKEDNENWNLIIWKWK